MRRKSLSELVVFGVLTFLLMITAVYATGEYGQAGNSNIAHWYLYEKDPTTWEIVEGGAWGKIQYNIAGPTFDFVFNGHGLTPNTEYSLIYYADPWPGNHPGALIASGTTNSEGDIHLMGSIELNMELPHPDDANYPDFAKIWLVLSSNYNAATNSVGWNPTEWLFEYSGYPGGITYDDTDIP